MPTAKGVLDEDRVIVEEDDVAHQLQSKGSYGQPSYEGLVLSLHEAAYLVEEDRLVVRDGQSQAIVPVDKLVARGSQASSAFETHHLVYREYRSRGFVVHAREDRFLDGYERGAQPAQSSPSTLIAPRGEAEPGGPQALLAHVEEATSLGRKPLLGVVDEESDVTYYEVDQAHVTGEMADPAAELADQAEALVLRQRAILRQDPGLASAGYGYEAGGQRYLSLAETHHLAQHGLTLHGSEGEDKDVEDVKKRALGISPGAEHALSAYTWLRERDLVPKTGFKYGVHYRIYEDKPGKSHAPYLVQALPAQAEWTLRDVSRFVRLSHSVNKRPIVWSPAGALMVEWTRP